METLIILGKYILSTALLLLFYWVVLRHRASYRLCRNYLSSIPLLGLLMCVLAFDVPISMPKGVERNIEKMEQSITLWKPADTPIEAEKSAEPTATVKNSVPEVAPSQSVQAEHIAAQTLPNTQTSNSLDYEDWAILTVVVVSALLLLFFVYYIVHVLHIRRTLLREKTAEGYSLIRSKSVNTPFSFGKTIFLPSELDSRSEGMIVRHEKAHIAHHHYLEVWHIEFWTRLCWFNPILWLCRSELRNVHEFEADRDVIRKGADIHTYQSTLLEMVMNESCPVVNGFNHSFIRQRFIEMKSSTAGTLGRVGKVALLLWVVVLFGSFTLRPASRITEMEWKMPVYPDPLPFVIDATLDEDSTETCFYLYMADSLFHIEEDKPDAVIPVIDHKIYYEMTLNKVTAGRLRGVGPEGKPTELFVEQFFVPGNRITGEIRRNIRNTLNDWSKVFRKSIRRTLTAFRHTHGDQYSQHLPQWEGKTWEEVEYTNNYFGNIESVCFASDKTIIKMSGDRRFSSYHASEFFLEDPQGKRYKALKVYPETSEQGYIEDAVYGYYEYYEPMPQDVQSFKIGFVQNKNTKDTVYYMNENVREVKKDGKRQKPNFELTIKASPGIPDCAYIIEYKKKELYYELEGKLVAELPLDQNHSCTFSTHLDSIVIAEVTAIFPDGTVCMSDDELPLVPGERVELNVYHALWQVSGGKSPFYKDWTNAKDACENIKRRTNLLPDNRDSLRLDYLKQHLDQLGCLYYYKGHSNQDFDEIEELPAAIMQTQFGREWTSTAPERAEAKARRLAMAKLPLWVFKDPENPNITSYSEILLDFNQECINKGIYVLDKEYKGDDPHNPYLKGFYRKNARNGVKVYKLVDKKRMESLRKEYYKR